MYEAMLKNITTVGMGRRISTSIAIALAAAATAGCRSNPAVRPQLIPMAVAAITGDAVEQSDAGLSNQYVAAYDGQPVAVTLDGSASTDADGEIREYRWLSATADPAGGRLVPGDAGAGWPGNGERVTVELDEGVWSFSLWVIDDDGLVSDQSTVTITVGNPPPPDGMGGDEDGGAAVDPAALQACIDGAFDGISDACKECTCSVSEECLAAIPACDEVCWQLISCVGTMCPDGDSACISENCSAFFGGAAAAMAAGTPCARPCRDACASE